MADRKTCPSCDGSGMDMGKEGAAAWPYGIGEIAVGNADITCDTCGGTGTVADDDQP